MNILFLCVANSARSQIAEGLAKGLFKNARIESAGSNPTGVVHELALAVLKEKGLDCDDAESKHWEDLKYSFFKQLDFVITLCEDEVCPAVPSKAKKLHWPQPDPALNPTLENFRSVRDAIEKQLVAWGKEQGLL